MSPAAMRKADNALVFKRGLNGNTAWSEPVVVATLERASGLALRQKTEVGSGVLCLYVSGGRVFESSEMGREGSWELV